MATVDRRTFLKLMGAPAAPRPAARPASARRSPSRRTTAPAPINDVEHVVVLMQENRSFDHYFGTLRGVRGLRRPAPGDAAVRASRSGTSRTAPATCCRSGRTCDDLGMHVPARPAARLERHARGLERRPATTSGCPTRARTTMAYHTRERHSVPLRARRRLHRLRRLPLLAASARPTPTAITCGPAGSATTAQAAARSSPTPRPATTGRPTRSGCERAGISWKIYQDVGVGLDAAGFWGWTSDAVHRQLRRQLAAVLPPVPERACPATPLADKAKTGTNIKAQGRDPDALLDIFRADVDAARCRRSRGSSRPRPTPSTRTGRRDYGAWYVSQVLDILAVEPRGVEQDGAVRHLRRGRRLLRPPGAADAAADAGAAALDRRPTNEIFPGDARPPARPVRPRDARADDRGLAVDQGRLGQLAGVRPHLADPLPRGALRRGTARPRREPTSPRGGAPSPAT